VKIVEGEENGVELFAAERGISYQVLADAGIRREVGGEYDGWFAIPYPHRSGIWKTRYRNPDPESQPKYLDDPGAKFRLYNPLLLGPGEEEIWFCEGEFDTLALVDLGLKAIGIHGVGNVPDDDEDKESDTGRPAIRKSWLLLFADTLCVTMFDNDDDGRKAGRRLARALNGEVFDGWNDEYGDVNDWWRDDPTGLAAAVDRFRGRIHRSHGMG